MFDHINIHTMKKQHILISTRNCMILLISVLALYSSSKAERIDPTDGKTIELLINEKVLNTAANSLEITAKGILRLTGLGANSQQPETIKFRIQIRHASLAGVGQLLFPWVEDYKSGQEFMTIPVDEILQKVKPGDQLIIIPVSTGTKYENSGRQFQIRVISDRC